MMKVEQMINNNGNGAMNQFILSGDGKIAFQSYASTIVVVDLTNNVITFGRDWNYSNTTNKHRNIFFRDYFRCMDLCDAKSIRKALKDGYIDYGYNHWAVLYDEAI